MVVFGFKLQYSGRLLYSGRVVVFVQKWLYSGKVVVFGQMWVYSGKSGFTWAKGLYYDKNG